MLRPKKFLCEKFCAWDTSKMEQHKNFARKTDEQAPTSVNKNLLLRQSALYAMYPTHEKCQFRFLLKINNLGRRQT